MAEVKSGMSGNNDYDIAINEEDIVGFCKECDEDLTEEESALDLCPFCALPLNETFRLSRNYNLKDEDLSGNEDTIVPCPICETGSLFGADECDGCEIQYSPSYWKAVAEDLSYDYKSENTAVSLLDELIDYEDEPMTLAEMLIGFGDQMCLNCNELEDDCECDAFVLWEDAIGDPEILTEEEREQAYEYTSPCSGCIHYYQWDCLPYRSWLHKNYVEGQLPGQIDYCNQYEIHPSIINIKVNA